VRHDTGGEKIEPIAALQHADDGTPRHPLA